MKNEKKEISFKKTLEKKSFGKDEIKNININNFSGDFFKEISFFIENVNKIKNKQNPKKPQYKIISKTKL